MADFLSVTQDIEKLTDQVKFFKKKKNVKLFQKTTFETPKQVSDVFSASENRFCELQILSPKKPSTPVLKSFNKKISAVKTFWKLIPR